MKDHQATNTHNAPILWKGDYHFLIAGTEHEDDSLYIVCESPKMERMLVMTLPTLCITYADMAFANAIGGWQLDYPESAIYGDLHFDPAIELNGEHEIRKFTWIRGAQQVSIGKQETVIQWPLRKKLVIPKLHISSKQPVQALIKVPEVQIHVDGPLKIRVTQLCNGRIAGGVQMDKYHPDWVDDRKQTFDLRVKAIDGQEGGPVADARVSVDAWLEDERKYVPWGSWLSDKGGMVKVSAIDRVGRVRLTVEKAPFSTWVREARVFAGQRVSQIVELKRTKNRG